MAELDTHIVLCFHLYYHEPCVHSYFDPMRERLEEKASV
jgi:hypothetical protein